MSHSTYQNTPQTKRSSFVSGMAIISMALGAMSVVSGVLQQIFLLAFSPADSLQSSLGFLLQALPPSLLWALNHLGLLNFISLIASIAITIASYGLWKRFHWGRLSFAIILLLSAIACCIGLWWFIGVMTEMNQMATMLPTDEVSPMFKTMQITVYASAAIITVLHLAIIWKLYTPAIGAEFKQH